MEINFGKNEIGKRIAEYRRERKLTQEELANRIGISAQALSQYERGMRYPDIEILKSLCTVLGVSSDYLIGLKETKINEIDDVEIEKEIWWNLRNSLSALSIVFGSDYVPSWNNNKHVELISNLRLRLSREGILMPIVRLSDWIQLKPREFIILAYDNVLYHEETRENKLINVEYIVQKLEEVVRQNYAEIINIDIIKELVDNLRINHNAIVDGIIPEKVPYGQLLAVCKGLLGRGDGMQYFSQIVEILGELNRKNFTSSDDEITDMIAKQLERPNNMWIWLHERRQDST